MSAAITILGVFGAVLIVATALREIAIHASGLPGEEAVHQARPRHSVASRPPIRNVVRSAGWAAKAAGVGLIAGALATMVGLAAGVVAVIAAIA